MSDAASIRPRPVSLFTVVFVFALLAAFVFVVRYFYRPTEMLPQNAAAENLSKDFEWRANREARRHALADLRKAQIDQTNEYGWVDEKNHVVRLPMSRA